MTDPQIQSERMLLCLIANRPFVIPELWAELFTVPDHAKLFNALKSQSERGEDVNLISAAVLCGLPLSLATEIDSFLATDPNVQFPLKDAWIDRTLKRIIHQSKTRSGIELLDYITRECETVELQLRQCSVQDKSHDDFIREMQSEVSLIKTGIDKFDNIGLGFGGFEPGEVVFIAARPATGKTAFLVQLALNISEHHSVDWHSFEMTAPKIRRRFIANMSGIFNHKIKKRELNPAEWSMVYRENDNLSKKPIRIFGSSGMNIDALRSHIQNSKSDVVMIDHLSCIVPTVKGSKNDMVGELSNKLRDVSKAYNKTLVVAVQLNRALEKENRMPVLSDLRDSGEIEQDADVVMFLTQPDKEQDIVQGRRKVRIDVTAAKMRDGETGIVGMMFDRPLMRFYEEHIAVPETQIAYF